MNRINADEMRSLIKSIFEFSQKLSGTIHIKTIDNAAEFAVNIFGYKNWQEFKQNLLKEKKQVVAEEIEDNNQKTLIYFKKDIYLQGDILPLEFKKRKDELIVKKKSNNTNDEWLIGSYLSQGMKTEQPRGLLSKDFIISGHYSDVSEMVVNKQINWLLEKNENFIIFSKKEIENIKFSTDVKKVGLNFYRLNPIKSLINSDRFDVFFRTTDLKNSFGSVWSIIVKKLYRENKNLSVVDLLNLTKLEKLVRMLKNLENDVVLHKMLSNYLSDYIDKSDNKILIKKESQERHYEINKYLINKITAVNKLYEDGYFSEKDEFSMKSAVFEKMNCVVLDYENLTYRELVVNEYIDAIKEFNKDKDLNLNEHSMWIIFLEAESWLKKYQTDDLLSNEVFHHCFYVYRNFEKMEKIFNEVEQILFLRQSEDYSDFVWKERMLNITESYGVNFWYNKNIVLKSLSDSEAILWSKKHYISIQDDLESYQIEKINLY